MTVPDIIENFVDELIQGGIQKKKPKTIPDVWNGTKSKNTKQRTKGKR